MNISCKSIIIAFISLIAATAIAAAETADEKALAKQHATLIKQIKKQNKAKKVIPQIASDGTLWFDIAFDYYHSMADSNGNRILPTDKYIKVAYMPAVSEGTSKVNPYPDSFGIKAEEGSIFHKAMPATIVGMGYSSIDILDASGNILKTITDKCDITLFPGYIGLVYNSYNNMQEGYCNKTIYLTEYHDGVMLLNAVGDVIVDKCKSVLIDENQYCRITRVVDGVEKMGYIKLDDPTFEIPVVFNIVSFDKYKKQWKVSKNRGDELEVYDPTMSYAITYLDKGEEYYNQEKWDDVINFYETEGLDAPWALYFTGRALYSKAYNNGYMPYYSFVSDVNEDSYFTRFSKEKIADAIPLATTEEMLNMSRQMLTQYCQTGDNEKYKTKSKDVISRLDDLKQNVIRLKTAYPQAIAKLNEQERQAALAAEAQRQQQAQMWISILGAFANTMQNITATTNSASASRAVPTTTSNYSTSSSSSSASCEKPDNSGRKAFLKGQIADWKNKLKKAEASYEEAMAGSDESWRKKKVLESKQNTINECLNMIKQYETELNSLK